jgi:hypothetical protein
MTIVLFDDDVGKRSHWDYSSNSGILSSAIAAIRNLAVILRCALSRGFVQRGILMDRCQTHRSAGPPSRRSGCWYDCKVQRLSEGQMAKPSDGEPGPEDDFPESILLFVGRHDVGGLRLVGAISSLGTLGEFRRDGAHPSPNSIGQSRGLLGFSQPSMDKPLVADDLSHLSHPHGQCN